MKKGFSELAGQLLAMWKQLGLNQRVSLVVATGVVVLGVIGLMVLSSRVSWVELQGGLDAETVAQVVGSLEDAKVPYQVRGAGSVWVPAGQQYAARLLMTNKGVTRSGNGYELFDDSNGIGMSDFQNKIAKKRAQEGELERMIGQIRYIESARVQLSMEENVFLLDPSRKQTASVMVKLRGVSRLPESAVTSIQMTVAHSQGGLDPANVSVTDTYGTVYGVVDDGGGLGGATRAQLRVRQELEEYLSRKAERMLTTVLGPGQAVVLVNADINYDSQTTYEEKYDPESQVTRSETLNEDETSETPVGSGGAVGMASNVQGGSNAVAGVSSNQKTTMTKNKQTETIYETPRTVMSLVQAGGTVERLSAAVFVAPVYTGSGTNRVMVPRSTNEIAQLKEIVRSGLGIRQGDATRDDEITLVEQEFNTAHLVEMEERMDRETMMEFWKGLGVKLVYPALGLMFLMMFWRAFKRTPMEDVRAGLPLGELGLAGNGSGN
ncbi:MAG: flagellar M-ring protein FliF, partial [Verrucomicrobiota bacterium]